MNNRLKIVVVGELDCGKSTLIGRLLFDTHSLPKEIELELKHSEQHNFAHLLDSFKEEQEGEFTLDTTQVFLKNKKEHLVIIDVPGHKELIKNMLTGASYADAAILIIDVLRGLGEQTKRHIYLLNFLDIKPVIVAINKMDMISYNQNYFYDLVDKTTIFFKKLKTEPLCFIPISAKEGENILKKSKYIPWYKGDSLLNLIKKLSKKEEEYPFRFIIQDIYKIKKENIIVGKILSGKIKLKDKLKVLPNNEEVTVKKIHIFPKKNKTSRSTSKYWYNNK